MKTIFFILIYWFVFTPISAQEVQKKFLLEIKNSKANLDSLLVYKLKELENENGLTYAINFFERMIVLEEVKTDIIFKVGIQAVIVRGIIISKDKSKYDYAESLLKNCFEEKKQTNLCEAFNYLSLLLHLYTNWDEKKDYVEDYYAQLLYKLESANCNAQKVHLLLNMSLWFYERNHFYGKAIALKTQALRIADSIKLSKFQIGQIYNRIGLSYYKINNFNFASNYWRIAVEIWDKNQIRNREYVNMLNSLGLVKYQNSQFDSAHFYYQKGLNEAIALKDTAWIGIISGNEGNVYFKEDNMDKAFELFQNDYQISFRYGNWVNACMALIAVKNIYEKKNQWEAVFNVLEKVNVLLKEKKEIITYEGEIDFNRIEAALYKGYSDYYMQNANYEKALKYYLEYANSAEFLKSVEHKQNIFLVENDLNSKLYTSESNLKKVEKNLQLIISIVFFSFVFFLVGIVILLIKNFRNNQKKAVMERKIVKLQEDLILSQDEKTAQEKQILGMQNELLKTENLVELAHAERLTEELAAQENEARAEQEKLLEKMRQKEHEMKEKEREMMSIALQINQKNELLNEIKQNLGYIKTDNEGNKAYLKEIDKIIKNNISSESDWEKFSYHFIQIHPDFFNKLLLVQPNLTQNELRQCAFVRVNLSIKDTAVILNISPKSVEMARYRLKKKLDLKPEDDFNNFIMSI